MLKNLLGGVDQRGGVLRDHQLFVGGDDPDGDLGVIGGNDGFLAPGVVLLGVNLDAQEFQALTDTGTHGSGVLAHAGGEHQAVQSAQSGQLQSLPMLFCAAERAEGDVVIPDGSFVPQVGDRLYLIGQPTGLTAFFRLLGRHNPRCRNVFLVGGGRIAHYLTAILERLGIHVKIIERSLDRCRHLSEVLPKATVICGDGTDQELLESENLSACDAFVALTDQDEDNIIISLYARQMGLSKIIAKCNRLNYAGIVHSVGLESVLSPKFITASHMLRLVRGLTNSQGSVMNALYRIADGGAEAMEFTVSPNTRNLGVALKDLRLKPNILIAVLVREQEIIIPEGSTAMQAGDRVIVISKDSGIRDLNDIYRDEVPVEGAQ